MSRPSQLHQVHEHLPGAYHWCVDVNGECADVVDIPVRHFCEVLPDGKIRAVHTVRYSHALEVEGKSHPVGEMPLGCECHEMPDLPDRLRALGVTPEQLCDHFLHEPQRDIFIPDPARPIPARGPA